MYGFYDRKTARVGTKIDKSTIALFCTFQLRGVFVSVYVTNTYKNPKHFHMDSAPYLHFQVLQPKDKEQREKALAYFKEHGKLYASFVNCLDILLYIGCTENVYIKSTMAEVQPEEFKSIMAQAGHWYRFYGKETNSE